MKVFSWDEILKSLTEKKRDPFFDRGSGISIGSFDGLHQGHRLLLTTLNRHCKKFGLLAGAFSFVRPLPSFKHSEDYQGDLTTLDQRLSLFEQLGLDFVIIADFTQDFASRTGVEFLQLLSDACNMQYIAEGIDFRCGYKGSTDATAIKYYSDNNNIKYDFVEPVFFKPGTDEEERISSSYIRTMILKRFLSTANELLTRPYSLELSGLMLTENGTYVCFTDEIKQALPPVGAYQCKCAQSEVRVEITEDRIVCSFDKNAPVIEQSTVLNIEFV